MLLSFFRPGKPGSSPASATTPTPPRTTGELLAMLGSALVARGLSVAIDPDGVTAATAGRTWRIAAVADDGSDRAAAPCRCGREDDAMAFPRTYEQIRRESPEEYRALVRRESAADVVRGGPEVLEWYRENSEKS